MTSPVAAGTLSVQEATNLISLTDPEETNDATTTLQAMSDSFLQQFSDAGARIRVLFTMRALLGVEHHAGTVTMPTTPETIALLFLLRVAASDASATEESRDFAKAALYEQLLRIEDLLKDDAMLNEQRKYKATAAVGKKGPTAAAHDAVERDAHRGHLFQKMFIMHAMTEQVDLGSSASQICARAAPPDQIESVIASWSAAAAANNNSDGSSSTSADSSANVSKIADCLGGLRKSWEKEHNSPSFNVGFSSRAIEMLPVDSGIQSASASSVLRHSKQHTKNFLLSPSTATPLSEGHHIVVAPHTQVPSPHNSNASNVFAGKQQQQQQPSFTMACNKLAHHARLLLPSVGSSSSSSSSPSSNSSSSHQLMFDASSHPQEWREGRSIVEAAASPSGDQQLSNAQLQKLTAILNGGGGSASSGGKNSNNKGGGNNASTHNQDLFPFLGITPTAYANMARSNPKAAVAVTQKLDKAWSDAYISKLVDFNGTDRPDAPSVVLVAARASLLTPSHLSTYVARAKTFVTSISSSDASKAVAFLKQFAVSLHQVAEKCTLDATDRSTIVGLINQHGDALSEVAKLWAS